MDIPLSRPTQYLFENSGLEELIEEMSKAKDDDKMTFWSRHDPINLPKGNTDHWAKCRQRTGSYKVTYGATGLNMRPDAELVSSWKVRGTSVNFSRGQVWKLPQKTLDDLIICGFSTLQGNFMNQRPRTIQSRGSLRTSFNDKAKEGFRYWLIEKPKPTKFGKYGIGSYKTVLGIGNAPRT